MQRVTYYVKPDLGAQITVQYILPNNLDSVHALIGQKPMVYCTGKLILSYETLKACE